MKIISFKTAMWIWVGPIVKKGNDSVDNKDKIKIYIYCDNDDKFVAIVSSICVYHYYQQHFILVTNMEYTLLW